MFETGIPVLYIDPGTGSMLFTIVIGLLGAGVYALRSAFLKIKMAFSGGKAKGRDGRSDGGELPDDTGRSIPFVLFSDDKRYWNVFGPLCRELDRRGETAVYMTASPDDPALSETFTHVRCRFIGEGNKAFAKLNLLKADVLLSTTPGLDVYQWKRSKEVKHYCHILHMASDATLYRMFGLDFYDSVLLSGAYQVHQLRQLEAVRSIPEKTLEVVGQPYMDELLRRLQNAPPLPAHETTVLLAPSWGPNSLLNRYGDQAIDALIATGYTVIVRPHPQSFTSEKALMDRLMAKYTQIEWNRDNDNFEVLRRSDILISDFSGVMFDFALVFNKPVIYADTDFDTSLYDACWLDEPLWTFRVLPQIGMPISSDGFAHIRERIDECLHDTKYRDGRQKARDEAWAHIGESASLTVDFLVDTRKKILSGCAEEEV